VREESASISDSGLRKRKLIWGGEEGQKRCRGGEQRGSGYNMQTALFFLISFLAGMGHTAYLCNMPYGI
jgi:hypothetical protein